MALLLASRPPSPPRLASAILLSGEISSPAVLERSATSPPVALASSMEARSSRPQSFEGSNLTSSYARAVNGRKAKSPRP
ncbi:hypothetical protein Zm00014a_015415 [Zea mays]|uniref:Uncharacterized protein n=1 Tax=Zea mays TaxID=4577 RepID=A0A3L6FJJ5_MAIZE|nr:hypothetical protein Zm00014a_015415 [Zea mays]